MTDSIVLVGIDEAGYGPVLGPLVASAAVFEVPVSAADTPLWEVLRDSVAPSASARDARISIVDSKKLYQRKQGLARLERSVLAVIGAWRTAPTSLHGLLGLLCPEVLSKLREYPWYDRADPALPRAADAGGVRIASALLARDLAKQSVRLAGCSAEVLLEGHYNRLVGDTRNKAVVLSGLVLRLIHRVAEAHPDRELHICIDKQGARSHYAQLLLRAFQDRRLKILEETDTCSAYELVRGRARWRVCFQQAGESHYMPVALASLVSKYVRELLMGCFNDYWARHVPALKPTAGYYQDGMRFIEDVQPHLRRLGIERDRLVRDR